MFQRLQTYDKARKSLKFPCVVAEKFDGVFCCGIKDTEGNVRIISRTGEEYTSMEHLKKYLKYILDMEYTHFVLFEAYLPDTPQATTNGYCRDTKEQHPDIIAMIYGIVGTNGEIRFTEAEGNKLMTEGCPYRYVYHTLAESEQDLIDSYNGVLNRGGEGIVITPHMVQPYLHGKRNATFIKMKQSVTYDLEVVGVTEGTGKYKGTLGALLVRWKDGKTLKVSGMTDAQRHEWYDNHSVIVGKIIEVQAMTESSKGKLREPRFKGIRTDKVEADA